MALPALASTRDVPAVAPNESNALCLIRSVCSNSSPCEETKDQFLILLVENPEEIHATDQRGYTALHWAAYYNDLEAAFAIIDVYSHLADPSLVNRKSTKNGVTPLMLAAQQNSVKVLRMLLRLPHVQLTETDSWKQTVLHLAAQNGNNDCIRALLQGDRDSSLVTAKDQWERTPFDVAVENGHIKSAVLLNPTYSEADIDHLRRKKLETNHVAPVVPKKSGVVIDLLAAVKKKKESNESSSASIVVRNMFSAEQTNVFGCVTENRGTIQVNTNGQSKKRVAISQRVEYPGDMSALLAMLKDEEEFDVLGKDMFGLNVLHKFASWDTAALVDALLVSNCSSDTLVNAQCPRGLTPLHHCVVAGACNSLKRLLADERVQLDICDNDGNTALDLARASPNAQILVPLFASAAAVHK